MQKMLSTTVMDAKLFEEGSQTSASWPAYCPFDASTRPVGSKAICTATIGQAKGPDHCPIWLVGLLVSLAESPPLPHPAGNDVKAPISRRMRIRPVDLNEYVRRSKSK